MSNERDAYRVLQVEVTAHEVVVRAAYRALAALYHPDRDQSPLATHRMAELNDAYARIRTRDRRDAYDRLRQIRQGEVSPSVVVAGTSANSSHGNGQRDRSPDTLDFGRYEGWSLQQIAATDPDYLTWLSRHSSGIRYRQRIEALLAQNSTNQPSPETSRKRR